MEFLDPKKRRAHRQKLFIGYGLIAIALTMITIIIFFAAYGFDIDRKTGQVIQNGMIVLDAAPESARISINGQDEGNTDKRLSLPVGQYRVELKRDGYRDWSKDVNLAGSAIEQLVYPFLFPSNLQTKDIQEYTARPTVISQSPDRRWLVVQRPGDASGAFQVVDLNDEDNAATTVVFPDGVLSAGSKHTFAVLEWSTNNNDLLMKHTYDDKSEFVVLDRDNPAESRNITTTFADRAFTSASLRDKSSEQFYLYNSPDKTLYSTDIRSKQYTLIADKVLSYKSYQKDVVLYVSPAASTKSADVHLLHKNKDKVIKTIAASPVYLHDAADFDGSLYVAVGGSNEGHLYLFENPLDMMDDPEGPRAFRALAAPEATRLTFSNNARFISVQSGSKFAVYDAETDRHYRYDTKLSLPRGAHATWMDGHRLTIVPADGKARVFDFDGLNLHELNAALPGSSVYFDRDYTALFTLSGQADAKTTKLTRTELRLNP